MGWWIGAGAAVLFYWFASQQDKAQAQLRAQLWAYEEEMDRRRELQQRDAAETPLHDRGSDNMFERD